MQNTIFSRPPRRDLRLRRLRPCRLRYDVCRRHGQPQRLHDGSSAHAAGFRSLQQKNPGVVVTISGTGSGNGIKALRDKMTDVAMSSRDLKDKEKKDFEAHGINPVKIPVALDAIIPVVSPKNAVASLTMEQLRDLFAGKIKNWKELGGADAPVVVVGRDSSSGTFESWQELVMGKTRVSQRALLQSSSAASFRPLPAIRTPLATSAWATSTARSRASS